MAFAGHAGGAIDDRVHARGPAADRLARGRRPADVFARQSQWAADLAARKAAATVAAREREREACTFMPTINPNPPVPPVSRLPSRSPPPPPLLTRQLGSPTLLPSSSSSVPVRGSVPFYALPTRTSELKLKGKEGEEGAARTRPRLSSGGPGARGFRVGGRAGRAADLARRAVEEERDWAEREAAVASGLDEAEALVGRGVSLAAALLASLDAALGGGREGAAGPAPPPAATGAADTRPSPSPSAAPEAAARPAFVLAQALFGPAQSSPPSPPQATHPRTATPLNSSGQSLRFDGLAAPFTPPSLTEQPVPKVMATPPFSSAAHSSPLSAIDALMQQAATPSSPSSSSADVLEASSRLQADLARLRQLSARTERVMARLIAEEEGGGGETS
jgi:hypothetical protein